MSGPDLGAFWRQNKERIGIALPKGTQALADALQTGAETLGLSQDVQGRYVHWWNPEGRLAVVFCAVPDPRELDVVIEALEHAQEKRPALMAVFVHQWTDGEGNWDVFAITSQRVLQHGDRIWGSDQVTERGPELRRDIYTLFACEEEFPEPGRAAWAELLAGPAEGVINQLGVLAAKHECTQTAGDHAVQWANANGQLETQFFILPDPGQIEAFLAIYDRIRTTNCPVSFVFVQSDEFRTYDIFRLSARSYLEHHNQARGILRPQRAGKEPTKALENLRWVPHWASHVGCIKGCLNYLGVEVSDAWLFGATGHAFVLNISDGLCPSGPTDWDTRRFRELGRNVGYAVEGINEWCPKKGEKLARVQQEAWDYVRNCLDEGRPCYGWELVHPEYFVIYGYDDEGYYVSGSGCDEGAGPIPWQKLGTSAIGMVLVSSVQPVAPADERKTVRDALDYALDVGHNRRKWTDRTGGLAGYDLWIETVEQGKAGRFGLGYNAAVWAESRKFAVEFLREARQRLADTGLNSLFDRAIAQYETVARNLRTVSQTYPFKEGKDTYVKVDAQALDTVAALKQARAAEATGLDWLSNLVEAMPA